MPKALELQGNRLRAALALASLLVACSSSLPGDADPSGAVIPAGPPLTVSDADLANTLRCPDEFTSSRNPVLLVHGTGANAYVAYDSGLLPVLQQQGYDACTIDLPHYSWGDIQIAAQYVVYAVQSMAERSGKHVSLVGHSQGVMENNWAIKWWPEVEALVDESIGVSGVFHGVDVNSNICAAQLCPPGAFQMDVTSKFLAAMLAGDETPGHADYTSLFSTTDGTAYPSAVLPGDTSVAVQDICPGREVGHSKMLFDAVAVALVLDALGHAGPADPARIDAAVCALDVAEGIDPEQATYKESIAGGALYAATIADAGLTTQEPPLESYASP